MSVTFGTVRSSTAVPNERPAVDRQCTNRVRLPVYLQRRLQSVLNAAARLVFRLRNCYDHVTDVLATLHWLRLPQRVDFKVAVMTFRVLHGLAPPYLNQLVRVADLSVVADFGQHRHTNCSCHHSG